MGIIVSVYRDFGPDCTNNGISSVYQELTVINIDGPFDATPERPPVELIQGPAAGFCPNPIIRAVSDKQFHTMFGGNFAFSSDSRFSEAVRELGGTGAVKIHDRIEL